MKTRINLIVLALAAISFSIIFSCNKVKELAAVDVAMDIPTTHFTYSQVTKAGEEILYSGYIRINLDSLLNVYGFSAGIIKDTYVTKFSVTMEDPPDATFSWLGSARAVVANDDTFANAMEVGSVVNGDPNAKTVNVLTNNVNIRPLLDKPDFYIRVYGVLNGPLPADIVGMYIQGKIQVRIEPI